MTSAPLTTARRRIAVVGSGVAGLTAGYVLQRDADVTLYEADDRLGGHAHTHDVPRAGGGTSAVDTGFLVHNERTYPTLLRLFAELGVATQDSEMSLSVRCDGCGLEYAGARGVRGLLARPRAAFRPRYVRMLAEVLRFHRDAAALLAREPAGAEQTLGDVIAQGRYSTYFTAHFICPLVSAVWSCAPQTAMRYPARYLFTFLANHGMLSVTGSPQWRTVTGGSRAYVELIAKRLGAVHCSTPVRGVRRVPGGVDVRDDADAVTRYDAVVVAVHADQALALIEQPSVVERELLGAVQYSRNETLLHTDDAVLPRSGCAKASWNYRMDSCDASPDRVLVSYDVSRLQQLPTRGGERLLVTLNDQGRVRSSSVIERMVYEHPIYTPESVAAVSRLDEIDDELVAFAGAYRGWGFHEDGCLSGLRAAQRIGGSW